MVRNLLKPRKRPKITTGPTVRASTACGNLYITFASDEDGLIEVFAHLGKAGNCVPAYLEGICRLISLALRIGCDPQEIVDQLQGIRCPFPGIFEGEDTLSCCDAIAREFKAILKNSSKEDIKEV